MGSGSGTSPRAFEQELRICSRVPLLRHRGHAGGSTIPQMCKMDRLSKTSYTAWITNFMQWGSAFQSSAQDTFRFTTSSHLVPAPCCRVPTIRLARTSSTEAHTSSWIMALLSYLFTSSKRGLVLLPRPALPGITVPTSALSQPRLTPAALPLPTGSDPDAGPGRPLGV